MDLEAKRPLPGHELRIVERMNVGEPPLDHELVRFFVGLVPDGAVEDDLGAVPARRRYFRRGRVLGHHDDRVHPVHPCRQRDALRVIAC